MQDVASPNRFGGSFSCGAALRPIRRNSYLRSVASAVSVGILKLGDQIVVVRGGIGSSDPGQIAYTNTTLRSLLYVAWFGMGSDQITSPPWFGSEKFDIVAKIPRGTSLEQFRLMLQNLLADRFHMVIHHSTKEFQGYELVVGKNGPKMKESSQADSSMVDQPASGPPAAPDAKGDLRLTRPGMVFLSRGQSTHLMAKAQTPSDLAPYLGNFLHSHVVDKTGLTGRYDFTLDFAQDATGPADLAADSAPAIPVALQDQLGLKLEPKKVLLDTVTVDSADRVPTEN